jgi:Na+/phosphate symporter
VVLLSATLAASNVISVPVALGLVLGANLGSGLLALMVNARTPGSGRSVAFGNLALQGRGLRDLRDRPALRDQRSRASTPTRAARSCTST